MKSSTPNSGKHPSNEGSLTASGAQRTGGQADPRLVIRGESIDTHLPSRTINLRNSKAFIDYLGFTYFADEFPEEEFPLKDLLTDIFNIPAIDWVKTKSGWNGYESRIQLSCYGLVAFGGTSQRQTIHVELSGNGCKQVIDWVLVHDWFVTTDSRITRIDLAHDDFNGKTVNVADAIKWFEEGFFNSNGRPPSRHLRDDFDSGDGKTLYIGKRGNDRFTRIYEKGKQLGDPQSNWCRAEIEFRAKSKVIPTDIFLYPDDYLAGAYKAFEYLSTEQSTFLSVEKEKEISLKRATEQARSAYGKLVNLLYFLHDNDCQKVVGALIRPGVPESLVPLYKQMLSDAGGEI